MRMIPHDSRMMCTDSFMNVNCNFRCMVGKMLKRRVCTTISVKHWELLKKHTVKYETQQKALEAAIDILENGQKQGYELSHDQKAWMHILGLQTMCHIQIDLMLELFRTADYERLSKLLTTLKLAEYGVVYYYQKPLKECSLKEVMHGIVIVTRWLNLLISIEYVDNGDYYTLVATHRVKNIEYSKTFTLFFDILFESYGAKTEKHFSEQSFFINVYKNLLKR